MNPATGMVAIPASEPKTDATPPLQTTETYSTVPWPAILAGAAGMAALTMGLLLLGQGLGLCALSPWDTGSSTLPIAWWSILWLGITQLLAAAAGGFLAGRLRGPWSQLGANECYFRDSINGFLAWSIASLTTVVILALTLSQPVTNPAQRRFDHTGSQSITDIRTSDNVDARYFGDTLFRKEGGANQDSQASATKAGKARSDREPNATRAASEAAQILRHALDIGSLPTEDVRYLGQLVAQYNGLPILDAEQRVRDCYARLEALQTLQELSAETAARKARKAADGTSLWLFVSLLMGALAASTAAPWGGRQRDRIACAETNRQEPVLLALLPYLLGLPTLVIVLLAMFLR